MQILLLGMPHSGASLVARILGAMGITLAPEELRHTPDEKISACWERSEAGRLHQRLFQSLEWDWDKVSAFHLEKIAGGTRRAFETQARALVDEWDSRRPWMLYDPGLCLLAPLWRPLLDQPVYVYVYRHPGQIAQALHARYGYSIPVGLALWEKYTVQSLAETQGVPCILVSYHDLLKDPGVGARRLYKRLRKHGLPEGKPPSTRTIQAVMGAIEDGNGNRKGLLRDYGNRRQEELCRQFRKGRLFGVAHGPVLSPGARDWLQAHERQREWEKTQTAHQRALERRTQEFRVELQRQAQALTERDQTVAALSAEVAQQGERLHSTVQWMEQLDYDINALFRSWTWRLGRLLVETACWLQLKRPGRTVREHMERVMGDFTAWRHNGRPLVAPDTDLLPSAAENGRHDEETESAPQPPRQISGGVSSDAEPRVGFLTRDTHGITLLPEHKPYPVSILSNLDPKAFKTKILYISPNLPDFDSSGGGKRATRMLALLAEECDVYAFTLGAKPDKHVRELTRNGVVVLNTYEYAAVKQQIPKIDVIIYAWHYTYQESIRFTELYPEAKVILDTVDVHWVREERSLGLWDGLTREKFLENKEKEIQAYRAADILWAVTEADKAAILKEIPNADVRVVSYVNIPAVERYQDPNNNHILFIGGYNHYPNISAVKKLALEIFPKVKRKVKDAKLIIAGAKAPPEVIALGDHPGIEFAGYVEDHEIEPLYRNTFITVVPLLAGAGVKIKICESIAYMTPVVTNAIGNEGINLIHEEEGLIADDFDDMARLIVKAMKRKYDFAAMTEKARKKLHALVGPEIVKERMLSSITRPVSICIVTWNRLDLLKRCIDSIVRNTCYCHYKILVYSNGCTDGTQDYLREAARENHKIIPVLSDKNEVFVKPNNQMMRMFPESDVVLVNNDVVVTPNWLSALHKAAHASESYGIAGSKILYPDGRLQEFGSELYADGTGRNIGKGDDPDREAYCRLTETGYVSGCAMYIKRSTIEKIGVFDEQFHPCYCEDSDYCYTAKEHGLATVVTPDSIVFHDEGGTSGTDTNQGFKVYQNINMKQFLKKHHGKNNGIVWNSPQKYEHSLV